MKSVTSILALAVALTAAVPASAGERGHSDAYRSYQHHRSGGHAPAHRHHRPERHHHHHVKPVRHVHHVSSHHHRTPKAEYLVGGVMLGVLLNELASDRSEVRTTTTTSYVVSDTPRRTYTTSNVREYLLDRDGRCYAVDYRGDTKVLTSVDSIHCR